MVNSIRGLLRSLTTALEVSAVRGLSLTASPPIGMMTFGSKRDIFVI
jgi:hypothetical protein